MCYFSSASAVLQKGEMKASLVGCRVVAVDRSTQAGSFGNVKHRNAGDGNLTGDG